MSMKKFLGSTSRQAMIAARSMLGEDAVIISTRKTAEGVEVVAATPNELSRMAEPSEPSPLLRPTRTATTEVVADTPSEHSAPVPFLKFIREQPSTPSQVRSNPTPAQLPTTAPTFSQVTSPSSPAVMLGSATREENEVSDEGFHALRQELATLRSWMGGKFDAMAYQDALKRRPVPAAIQKDLLISGFSPKLARDLTSQLPNDIDEIQARTWTAAVLEKNLLLASPEQDLIDAGGIYALVGPTGVGKTTTVAKLAARCAMKYGRDSVGLITIDSYRIGAQDQLRIYGKILGISVHTAQDRDSLMSVLRSLTGKRLILIDTVGLGQRDERVAELLATLGVSAIKRLLVLNSAAQAETLEDVVTRYRGASATLPLTGVILSKTDEAVRLGTGMDVAIRYRLPVYYETHGQRVPEDIAFADGRSLVRRAMTHVPARAFQVPSEEVSLTFLEPTVKQGTSLHA